MRIRRGNKNTLKNTLLGIILILISNVKCNKVTVPEFGGKNSDFLKKFSRKFIDALNRDHVVKLKRYYSEHCSNLDEGKLVYSHERLLSEDKKLASFLNFTRKDPSKIPLENVGIRNILSLWGWFLLILPIVFMCTSIFSFLGSCMFFYCPSINSKVFRILLNQDFDIEVVDNDQIPLEQREYYKTTKNVVSKSKNLFRLFVFKFCMSIGLMMSLLFGLGVIINFDETADCGITKAALNVLEGKEGNYFTEFGITNNSTLLHKFREDLESFEHHKDIDYQKIIDYDLMNKATLLQDSFIDWHQKMAHIQLPSCTNSKRKY